MSHADGDTFYESLARQAGLSFAKLDPAAPDEPGFIEVDGLAARLLSETLCRHFGMLPIAVHHDVLTVAICVPFDPLGVAAAVALTGYTVRVVIVDALDLDRAIERSSAPMLVPDFEQLGPAPTETSVWTA